MAALKYTAIAMFLLTSTVSADDRRAKVNYQIHCQGCHLPDALGFPGKVPRMNNFVGYFLHSQEGREFLVRVPGVASSRMSDADITEVMNWLLRTYSAEQLPDNFKPFTVAEVAALRQNQEMNPEAERMRILRQIAVDVPELASDLEMSN